ncbi:MAG TPA: EF-hand domain-containing protein [Burkholderiaceae bacterium]|nr:EF-hand domain-containing protein [Burkholderiaceae bacterium]
MPHTLVSPLQRGFVAAALAALCLACAALPAPAELSAVEREAIEAAFARADTNGDGKLSREEAQRLPEIAARFDELDRDHDGFLSFAEFVVGATPPEKQ